MTTPRQTILRPLRPFSPVRQWRCHLRLALTALLAFVALTALPATVLISLTTQNMSPATNRPVNITGLGLTSVGYIPTQDVIYTNSDSNGNVYVTLWPGYYQCDVAPVWGQSGKTEFYFYVDPSNAVQSAATNLLTTVDNTFPGPEYAYPASASDARYDFAGTAQSLVRAAAGNYLAAGPGGTNDGETLTNVSAANLQVATNNFGNTSAYYMLIGWFDQQESPSSLESWTLFTSVTPPYTNWSQVSPTPVYADPNWFTNTDYSGPSALPGGSTIEVNGTLYTAYGNQPNVNSSHPLKAAINIAASTDLTNWTWIATYTNNDPWTNSWSGVVQWSQVNYGGTNWLVFNYETNQSAVYGYTFGSAVLLPVALSGSTATFGQPIVLVSNNPTALPPSMSIITNNAGDYILTTSTNGPCFYSTNFFGPYTNLTAWSAVSWASMNYIYAVSNGTTWLEYNGGSPCVVHISTSYGTNWQTLSTGLLPQNKSMQAFYPNQICPFQLTTPLTNTSSSAIAGSDATFTGTVKSRAVSSQSVRANNVYAQNAIFSGVVAGTPNRPLWIVGNAIIGMDDSNQAAPYGTLVLGEQVLADTNAGSVNGGNIFAGYNFSTHDGGPAFEWEDGNDPVDSPLAFSGGGGFYVNAIAIKFDQSPVNAEQGFQSEGVNGLNQNISIQTNSSGPHGIILKIGGGIITNTAIY